jgi:hypothetical protein
LYVILTSLGLELVDKLFRGKIWKQNLK